MKPIPIRALRKLIADISRAISEHPEAKISLEWNGAWGADRHGELHLGLAAEGADEIPGADAEVELRWERQKMLSSSGTYRLLISSRPAGGATEEPSAGDDGEVDAGTP